MGKLLRVSLVAAVMALFCVIPAFAALSVSSDTPPIDFSQYIPSDWGFSESDVIYLLIKEEEEAGDIAYHCIWTVDSRWLTYDGSSAVGLIYDECSLYGHFRFYPDFDDSWGIKKFLEPQKDGVIVTGELISSNFISAPEPSDSFLPSDLVPSDYPSDLPLPPNFELYVDDPGNFTENKDFLYAITRHPIYGTLYLVATWYPNAIVYDTDGFYINLDPEYGDSGWGTFFWQEDHWECSRPLNYYTDDGITIMGDVLYANYDYPVVEESEPDPEPEPDPDPPYVGPKPVPPKPEVPSHSYQTAVGDDGEVEDPDVEPGSPMEDLNLLVGSIFGILTQLYNLYAGTWLLTGFLMLWLIRRVSKLFNRL